MMEVGAVNRPDEEEEEEEACTSQPAARGGEAVRGQRGAPDITVTHTWTTPLRNKIKKNR